MSSLWMTLLLLPRNACLLVLRGYRAVISPLYGDVCRFYPSCSHYALQAIQRHGALRGIWLGSARIVRCHPWAIGGIDDVPGTSSLPLRITRHGFVVAGVSPLRPFDQHDFDAQLHSQASEWAGASAVATASELVSAKHQRKG